MFMMVGTYITENAAYYHGLPLRPSYQPSSLMSTSGERMTFWERMSNLLNYMIFTYYQTQVGFWSKQNEL
jgi:hypothetical protein